MTEDPTAAHDKVDLRGDSDICKRIARHRHNVRLAPDFQRARFGTLGQFRRYAGALRAVRVPVTVRPPPSPGNRDSLARTGTCRRPCRRRCWPGWSRSALGDLDLSFRSRVNFHAACGGNWSGVFDACEHVYRTAEAVSYVDDRKTRPGRSFKDWRTYRMSDHLPMWIEFDIDDADAWLVTLRG